MEMADAIVINKADGDNIKKAKLTKTNLIEHYICFPKKSGWIPTTSTCSLTQEEF
jgi:LAO/AO transport system kinase